MYEKRMITVVTTVLLIFSLNFINSKQINNSGDNVLAKTLKKIKVETNSILVTSLKNPSLHPSKTPVKTRYPTKKPTISPSLWWSPTSNPTSQPSSEPFLFPTSVPTELPSSQPSGEPSGIPSTQPTNEPSGTPSSGPSSRPSIEPASSPSSFPSIGPTHRPSDSPIPRPSALPLSQPTLIPVPICEPTTNPLDQILQLTPSCYPTLLPTATLPSQLFTATPVQLVTLQPTHFISNTSIEPSVTPSGKSMRPSRIPFTKPSKHPILPSSATPSFAPIVYSSSAPSSFLSVTPSKVLSVTPTSAIPAYEPSSKPSIKSSYKSSSKPTRHPSKIPTIKTTKIPSSHPSGSPTTLPTIEYSLGPSLLLTPSFEPTKSPSNGPSVTPSIEPADLRLMTYSCAPSNPSTISPSCYPSDVPSATFSAAPLSSMSPNLELVLFPSVRPTSSPLVYPTILPSVEPSWTHSNSPIYSTFLSSSIPTLKYSTYRPTRTPARIPSKLPSFFPSVSSSNAPTRAPSILPSIVPILLSSTGAPTFIPSRTPSSKPSTRPSSFPSPKPLFETSLIPTNLPTTKPVTIPTEVPSIPPSMEPFKISRTPSAVPSNNPTVPTQFPTTPTSTPTDGGIYFSSVNITSISGTSVTVEAFLYTQAVSSGFVYCLSFPYGSANPSPSNIRSYGSSRSFISISRNGTSLVLGALSPVTKYSISCVATLNTGVSKIYENILVVETTCCKLAYLKNAPLSVYGDPSKYITNGMSSISYVYSFFLSSAPGESVTITPTFSFNGEPSTAIAASPESFVSTNKSYSSSQVFSFYIKASSDSISGMFELLLSFSGPSAAEYKNTSTMVTIIPTGYAALPAPHMTSAKLSDSGISFYILFDVPTDFANILETTWKCSRLFSFTSVVTTTCTWTNASAVKSTLDSTSTVLPGQEISLKPNLLRSQCQSNSDCGKNAAAGSSTTTLLNPDNPIYPHVSLSSHSATDCQDLSIDASASSGSGGRPFQSISWYVTKDGHPIDSVILYLNSITDISLPIKLPTLLVDSGSYLFFLTLTNIFGFSSTSSISASVSSNVYVPSVSIVGSSDIRILPYDSLSVSCVAAISSCANISARFMYKWTLLNNDGSVVTGVATTSRDPKQYSLAPYSLSAGFSYILSLTVKTVLSGRTEGQTTVLVHVFVTETALSASIVGGYTQQVPIDSKLVLDASSSQDLNYRPGGNPNSLLFVWTCTIVSLENFGGSCGLGNVFDSTANVKAVASSKYELVTIPPNSFAANISYSFTLYVFSIDGRSDSKVLSLRTGLPGSLTLVPSSTFSAVNYGTQCTLSGFVRSNTSISVNMAWSLFFNLQPVPLVALTALTRTFSPVDVSEGLSFPLVVDPSCLQASRTYTFRLSAWPTALPHLTSHVDLQVRVRSPPQLGTVVSSPTYGFGLQTIFVLSAPGWADDEADATPLSYVFSYQLSSLAPENIIGSQSNIAHITTTLPVGLDANGNNITIRVTVYDSFGGFNSATSTVTVTKFNTLSVSSFVSQNLAAAVQTGNNNFIYQAIAGAASVFNVASCASAPNCTKLNRLPCSTVPNTCGGCVSGHIGIAGAANYPCSNSSTSSESLHTILALERTCPSNSTSFECSGTGRCTKYDSNGAIISRCTFEDTTCTASCICANGYGGSDCSITPQNLEFRNNVRQLMCNALSSSIVTTNPSASNTAIYLSSMFQIYAPSEVQSSAMLQECANTFLVVGKEVYYGTLASDQTASTYLSVLSSFVTKPLIANNDPKVVVDPSLIESYVSNFQVGYTRNLVAGQYAVNFTSSKVSMTLRYDFGSSLENLTLVPPSDSSSSGYGKVSIQPSIKLPPSGLSACGLHKNKAQISITAWNSNPFQSMNNSVAPLLSFGVLRLPSELENTTPAWAVNETYYVTLPFSTSQRERKRHVPECIVYDSKTDSAIKCPGCKVSSVSSKSVTYICHDVTTLCTLFAQVKANQSVSRNLGKDDDITPVNQNSNPSTSTQPIDASKTFGTTFNALGTEIITISSLQGFNPNTPAAKATISVFSFVIFAVVAGYLYFRHWDKVDCRENDDRNKRIRDQLLKQQTAVVSNFNVDSSNGSSQLVETKVNAEEVIEHFVSNILPTWVSDDASTFWVFVAALQKHHLYVSCFLKFSVLESRTLRFLKLMQYFLILLFVNTLFFDVAYPYKFSCTGITDEHTCLSMVSSITGAPLCAWEPPSDDSVIGAAPLFNLTGSNSTLRTDDGAANAITQYSYVCTFIPSGSGPTYTLMVALMCLLISQPIQLMLIQLTYNYCIKKPDFRGLLSWLNRSLNVADITGHTPDPIYSLDHFHSSDFSAATDAFNTSVAPSVEADSLIAEALYHKNELNSPNPSHTRKYYQSHAQDTKRNSRMIVEHFEKLAGVTINDQASNGAAASLSPKEYNALCSKLTAARKKSDKIRKIILEMDGFHSHFRDNVLINRFIAEQLNRVQSYRFKMFALSLDHTRAEKVAGWKWIVGWIVYCGIIGYFMYFIFAWTAENATVTIQLWGLNMLVAFCQDFFGVQVVNVFIIYVMGIESIRPHLMHILVLLKETAMTLTKYGPSKPESTKHILQHFSGSCRAAYSEELKHLAAARILRELSDDDIAECHIFDTIGHIPFLVGIIFAALSFIALMSSSLGNQLVFDAFVPSFITAFFLFNSVLFSTNTGAMIAFYVLLVALYLYVIFIFRPSKRRVIHAQDVMELRYMDTTINSKTLIDVIKYQSEEIPPPSTADKVIYALSWDGIYAAFRHVVVEAFARAETKLVLRQKRQNAALERRIRETQQQQLQQQLRSRGNKGGDEQPSHHSTPKQHRQSVSRTTPLPMELFRPINPIVRRNEL